MIKTCNFCNKQFEAKTTRKQYCCSSCKDKANYRKNIEKNKIKNKKYREQNYKEKISTIICIQCGEEFTAKRSNAKFCSNSCKGKYKYKRKQYTKKCKFCNKEFITNSFKAKFCSNNCRSYNHNGYKLIKKECPICFTKFTTMKEAHKYCCRECYEHSDDYKMSVINKRHKRRNNEKETDITNHFLLELKENTDICEICGKKLEWEHNNCYNPLYPNLDHIIPLNCGGTHTKDNVRYICRNCNIHRPHNGSDLEQRI